MTNIALGGGRLKRVDNSSMDQITLSGVRLTIVLWITLSGVRLTIAYEEHTGPISH